MTVNNNTIYYLCNDPERAFGVENIISNYTIVCIDNSPLIEALRSSEVKVFSLAEELKNPNPIFRNTNRLLTHPFVKQLIQKDPNNKHGIVFKIAPNIEKTAEELNLKLLNPLSRLNRLFEFKISQYKLLSPHSINFPQTLVQTLEDANFDAVSAELGLPFVVQFDRGHTGSSTVFIKTEDEFKILQQQFPKRVARIAKFIEGPAWTINACVTRFGISYGGLSYQITGIPECTNLTGATVGNDWTKVSTLSRETKSQIENITEKVGNVMRQAGFRGLFGLDFVINENGEVFLIEVNARQPASTGMHSKLILQQRGIPLILLHIAEFMYEDDDSYLGFLNSSNLIDTKLTPINTSEFIKQQNRKLTEPLQASQLFIRNKASNRVIIKDNIKPGIYSTENLSFIRSGYNINQLENDKEILILSQAKWQEVGSNSEVARIQAPFSLINEKDSLNSVSKKIVDKILNSIRI